MELTSSMKKIENKKRQKLTVTIGIPAYNEEKNIGILLKRILSQKQETFSLNEIIIYLDGSTDSTRSIIESFQCPIIRIIEGLDRVGQQEAQNIILREYKSEILVFIEADVVPANSEVINSLIKPFHQAIPRVGMIVGNESEVMPITFFGKVSSQGNNIKRNIASDWKHGDNIYSSGGHAMKALTKDFASKLRYPKDVPEDSYTYLRLRQLNQVMMKQWEAKTYARSVQSISDSIKQSRKFVTGKKSLEKCFSKEIVEKEFSIPFFLIVKHIMLSLSHRPVLTVLFFVQVALNRVFNLGQKKFDELYMPYDSSKQLFVRKS